jgi:hypothetical protein
LFYRITPPTLLRGGGGGGGALFNFLFCWRRSMAKFPTPCKSTERRRKAGKLHGIVKLLAATLDTDVNLLYRLPILETAGRPTFFNMRTYGYGQE